MALLAGACSGSGNGGNPNGPSAITITAQPQNQTIASGTPALLSVTAMASAPLSYQWYVGSGGTTTNPIAGATASNYTTPALTTTTSYWVRVSIGGSVDSTTSSVDSTTATITVTPLTATPPTIMTQPQNQTIASGTTAMLSVMATGTSPLSYQWYVGSSGTTTDPITGATMDSYTTPPLTSTTTYWVRVSNTVNHADSTTATITITPPTATPPTITTQPQSQTIASGTTAMLSVTATGTSPLRYQWYVGPSGTTTNPVAGAMASSYTTPALTATTSYWVRVSNAVGNADSTTATVTVGCTPPTITTQPQNQTIASGTTAALSVTATGTAPLSYQWYVGPSGTTTNPIAGATGPNYTTPALTTTTSYWVRVSNACGSAASTTATITVRVPPSIAVTQEVVSGTIPAGVAFFRFVFNGTGFTPNGTAVFWSGYNGGSPQPNSLTWSANASGSFVTGDYGFPLGNYVAYFVDSATGVASNHVTYSQTPHISVTQVAPQQFVFIGGDFYPGSAYLYYNLNGVPHGMSGTVAVMTGTVGFRSGNFTFQAGATIEAWFVDGATGVASNHVTFVP